GLARHRIPALCAGRVHPHVAAGRDHSGPVAIAQRRLVVHVRDHGHVSDLRVHALLLSRRRELVRTQLSIRQLAAAPPYRAPQRPADDGSEHESHFPDRRLAVRDLRSRPRARGPSAERLQHLLPEEELARRPTPSRRGGGGPDRRELTPKPGHAERRQNGSLRRHARCGCGAGVLERFPDPAGTVDLCHYHRRVHGGGDVDLPGSRREKRRREEGEVADPFRGRRMTLHYQAAVLHEARSPLQIETVTAAPLTPSDVLVCVRAAGLCHTDLEVIDGSLRYPMPIVLGHEAAGVIEDVGSAVRRLKTGDHVILSWNPHCGHCYYCDRGLPILCEDYLAKGPQAVQFDGTCKA